MKTYITFLLCYILTCVAIYATVVTASALLPIFMYVLR